MQIQHFCTYPHGGAAIAALRLHRALLEGGTSSSFYYALTNRQPPAERGLYPLQYAAPRRLPLWSTIGQRLRRVQVRQIHRLYREHLENRPTELETFSMAEQVEQTRLPDMFGPQSLAHLHWIAYLADYPSFFASLPAHVPLVWTLHDMNPFTGGCHFAGGCDRFAVGCGNCPQVLNPRPADVSRHSFAVKQRALRQRQIHVVSPSRWLLGLAQKSSIWPDDTAFSVIRYGIDTSVFHPVDKRQARDALGIRSTATVIGFVADQLQNPRKGAQYLWQSLAERKSNQPLELLTMGSGKWDRAIAGVDRVYHLGYLERVEQQVQAYAACDFVVIPSLEDNQPQVGLEALACGVPIVGFAAGGTSEVVQDGIHGLMVPRANAQALERAIDWMASHPDERHVMGQRGRLTIVRDFDAKCQAEKYLALYRDELSQAQRQKRRAA